jgi:hypothetical protein
MPPAPYDTGVEALSNAPKTHSQILADGVIRIYASELPGTAAAARRGRETGPVITGCGGDFTSPVSSSSARAAASANS